MSSFVRDIVNISVLFGWTVSSVFRTLWHVLIFLLLTQGSIILNNFMQQPSLRGFVENNEIPVDLDPAICNVISAIREAEENRGNTETEFPFAVYSDAVDVLKRLESEITHEGLSPFSYTFPHVTTQQLHFNDIAQERREEVARLVIEELAIQIARAVMRYMEDSQEETMAVAVGGFVEEDFDEREEVCLSLQQRIRWELGLDFE